MKKYIDWGREKEWVVIEGNSLPFSLPFKKVLEQIEKNNKIYLESGCPKQFLRDILEKEAKIFIVDAKKVKKLRDSENVPKSDFADCIAIKKFVDYDNEYREFTWQDFEFERYKSIYYLYERTTKHIVALKNSVQSYKKEYGKTNQTILGAIKTNEKLKKDLLKQLVKAFGFEINIFSDIKGVGERYVIGILLEAHPKKFRTLSRFLIYCGLKSQETTNGKFNRQAKMLFHQIAVSIVMQKDEKYYPFYQKIKEELKENHKNWTKGHVDNAAKNRIATFIAKEIYRRIRNNNHVQKSV